MVHVPNVHAPHVATIVCAQPCKTYHHQPHHGKRVHGRNLADAYTRLVKSLRMGARISSVNLCRTSINAGRATAAKIHPGTACVYNIRQHVQLTGCRIGRPW